MCRFVNLRPAVPNPQHPNPAVALSVPLLPLPQA